MDIEHVAPELREATQKLRLPPLDNRVTRRVVRMASALMPVPKVGGVTVRRVRLASSSLRVYQPHRPPSGPCLLWIHGGGFLIGNARQDEALCAGTAAELGMVVVSANYRLAPQFRFPAALNDVADAWRWIQMHASELGVDGTKVAIGGESAGGGLAATLVHRLRDTSTRQPAAQWLFSPMLDDRTAADVTRDSVDHWVWNNVSNRLGWHSYLGAQPGSARVPEGAVAARRVDLSGIPPTFIAVGDIELFHAENVEYARRLSSSGVEVALDIVPGAPHGFENWARATTPARLLIARAQAWLEKKLR